MARSRNIKPGFCANEVLGQLPPVTRLLFVVLPMFADREGRLEDRPLRIRAQAFPYDSFDLDPMLTALHDHGFIVRYRVGNEAYIQILKFSEHQSPHVKEAASTIPAPDKHQASTGQAPDKADSNTSVAPPDSLIPDSLNSDSLIPDSLNSDSLNPDSGENTSVEFASEPDRTATREIFDYWRETLNHPKARLDEKRRKKIHARLKDGYGVDDIKAAIRGCANSPHHQGENDRGATYDDIELICRDGPHVDAFIRLDRQPENTRMSAAARRTAAAAQRWLEENTNA